MAEDGGSSRRTRVIVALVAGLVAGAIAAGATALLGLEGTTDVDDVMLLAGLGLLVAALVSAATYAATRPDQRA